MAFITISGYPIDLAETEEHSLKSEITDHPVEDGSDVGDNIRRKPRELTLTGCVVSDTPIGAIANDDTRILGDSLPPISKDAFAKLEAFWLAGEPVVIVTGFKKYDSMGIEEITVPRESKDAGGLVFTIHCKEIRIVQNKRVTMALPNTGDEQNLGLSIDNLFQGNKVLWRKGSPPGTSPATIPAGVITGQEVVVMSTNSKGRSQLTHQSTGKPLTDAEFDAFDKDTARDEKLMVDRNAYRANQLANHGETTAKRGNDLANYKIAHPGENPDPSQFGLGQDSNGYLTAK